MPVMVNQYGALALKSIRRDGTSGTPAGCRTILEDENRGRGCWHIGPGSGLAARAEALEKLGLVWDLRVPPATAYGQQAETS